MLDLLIHTECTAVLLRNLLRLVQKRPLVINVIFISCVTFDPCTHFLYAASVKINWMLYQCGHRYIFFSHKEYLHYYMCSLKHYIGKYSYFTIYKTYWTLPTPLNIIIWIILVRTTTIVVLSNDYNNPIVLYDDIS